jgi:hypothetical protein
MGIIMGIELDFAKLLGFKVTLRALRATEGAEGQAAEGKAARLEEYSAVLRSRIGVKGVPGLRYRHTV